MVDSINTKSSYARIRMAQLPDVERGEKRKIKRGDCLWNIAKEEVKKQGKTTNAAISDYMLQIAKVNGFDTPEKRKNIKIGSEIYLPGQVKRSDKAKGSAQVQTQPKAQNQATKSYIQLAQKILNDKTLYVESARLNLSSAKVYHVYAKEEIKLAPLGKKLICSFDTTPDGKIRTISFENTDGNLNPYGYDYDIDNHGAITARSVPYKPQGKVDASQMQAVFNKLQSLMK